MTYVGLEAIHGQDDATAGLGDALEASRVLQREGHQFIVTLQEIGDRSWGDGHPAVEQVLVAIRQTAVLRRAQGTDPSDDIQAKCVLG